jgi:hypothetical protein
MLHVLCTIYSLPLHYAAAPTIAAPYGSENHQPNQQCFPTAEPIEAKERQRAAQYGMGTGQYGMGTGQGALASTQLDASYSGTQSALASLITQGIPSGVAASRRAMGLGVRPESPDLRSWVSGIQTQIGRRY